MYIVRPSTSCPDVYSNLVFVRLSLCSYYMLAYLTGVEIEMGVSISLALHMCKSC